MKPTRLTLVTACLTAAFLLIGLHTRAEPAASARDHVLLITIDDLNDWIGCLSDPADPQNTSSHLTGRGHPQASTPNMDRLAQRGVLFTNAHCQAPICRPSRTSFFSGLRPTTSGIYGNRPQYDAQGPLTPGKDLPWITRRFEQAGYDVYTAGKLLHASRNKPLGGTPCFKTSQGPYPREKIGVPPKITPNGIWDYGPYPDKLEDYTDYRIAKWTIDRMNRPVGEDGRPRFLALGFYNPHVPLFAPPAFFDAAPSTNEVLLHATTENDLEDLSEIAKRMGSRVAYQQVEDWLLSDEQKLRELTRAYLASTSAMDYCIGKVMDALDKSDMADNTWIVVVSDHGWHLGEKNHVAKQTLWTRSTRVPMIIVPPKRIEDTPRGVRCDRPAELLDVYPTLVEAVGLEKVETDRQLDGVSLLPWLAKPQAAKERPAITTIYAHNHSLVGDRYRYTRYADGSEELYDRQSDPHEFSNLISQVDTNDRLKAVVNRLKQWVPEDEAGEPDLVDDRVNQ